MNRNRISTPLDNIFKSTLEYFDIAYFCERSIEDEIDATSAADLKIFIISYLVIFLYIMFALGSYSTFVRVPVDMKVSPRQLSTRHGPGTNSGDLKLDMCNITV